MIITKKSINNIKLSIIYFIVTVCSLTIIYSLVEVSGNKTEKEILKYTDIKEVAVDISIHNSGYFDSDMDKLYVNNKELIKLIVNNSFYSKNEDRNHYLEVYLKNKKNDVYRETISLTKEDYNKLIDIIDDYKEYVEYHKNIDYDKVYAVKIGENLYNKEESKAILKLVKDTLSNLTLKELFELQRKYSNVENEYYISLYSYMEHDRQEFKVNGYINYDLLNSIVNSNNSLLKENIEYIIPNDYSVYYLDKYTEEDFEIDYYVLRNAKNEIYDFILSEVDKKVDMKYEYITLEVYLNSNYYSFTTNNIKGFKEILDKKYEEIKETDEYKQYYNDDHYKYYDEDVVYDY